MKKNYYHLSNGIKIKGIIFDMDGKINNNYKYMIEND